MEWVRANGAPGVFLLVALENLGIPWIAVPGYIVAGEIVRAGRMSFWSAVLLITAGHMTGATIAWAIMRAGENALSRFFLRNKRLERAHAWLCRWYARRGPTTLLAGRLLGQIRPWASLAAGMARVGVIPFLVFSAIGSAAYSAAAVFVWLTGIKIWLWLPQMRWLLIVLMLVSFFGLMIYLLVKFRKERREVREIEEERSVP